ncbi:MAG TPA: N-succinylarginine dihydrolase [Nevskiaceae bacterium]|nr:N-succinylarginine dihydrolase [Nevskiaceae bacterium]
MSGAAAEANFDGLVGPTHNYAGLSLGNVASLKHAQQASNPREAALQGLAKMHALAELGLHQGVLPPHERPHIPTLKKLGFGGSEAAVLARAAAEAPALLAAASSASAMWVANAATVSPSADTADRRVHFTPANLCSHLHRAIEPRMTARILKATFRAREHFAHHLPLPSTPSYGDEGAANHTRLCSEYGEAGLELFAYGRGYSHEPAPQKFPARQTRHACAALVRLHGLQPEATHLALQSPEVIDQGVFHNDVIAVGNREVLLYHERAYADAAALRAFVCTHLPGARRPVFIEVRDDEVSVEQAVSSYLFNSQLVCPPGGGMLLVCAAECREQPQVWRRIEQIVADDANPITEARLFDLHQSMHNGGGPACLRLRVVLTGQERAAVNPRSWITPLRYRELCDWVQRHYRDRLEPRDLADPKLLYESRRALDELTQLLGLGMIYDFQR